MENLIPDIQLTFSASVQQVCRHLRESFRGLLRNQIHGNLPQQ